MSSPARRTTGNPATEAFEELSAHHSATRRIALLGTLTIVITALVIVVVIDATRTNSAHRYAGAVQWKREARMYCDHSLSKRHLWFGPVLSAHDLCADHADWSSQAEAEQITERSTNFSFLVLGDWGRDGMCCQRDVAIEMSRVALRSNPKFVVSTGDNFYHRGIQSAQDSQVDRSWRSVYITPHRSLRVPWKVVLGNHDHAGVPEAQVTLNQTEPHWSMPNLYYFETMANGAVFMAYIDTTCMFYTEKQKQHLLFDGESETKEYCEDQLVALRNALQTSHANWKIVVGHHVMFSSGESALHEQHNHEMMRTTLLDMFRENKVAAYFNGHEHLLEHFDLGDIQLFTTGAGSKLATVSRLGHIPVENKFSLDRQGFAQAVMNTEMSAMTVNFYDLFGEQVYSTVVKPQ